MPRAAPKSKAEPGTPGGAASPPVLADPRVAAQLRMLETVGAAGPLISDKRFSPRTERHIDELLDVLGFYGHTRGDIAALVQGCNYDQAQIQTAIANITEDRRATEVPGWDTVLNKKQLKEKKRLKEEEERKEQERLQQELKERREAEGRKARKAAAARVPPRNAAAATICARTAASGPEVNDGGDWAEWSEVECERIARTIPEPPTTAPPGPPSVKQNVVRTPLPTAAAPPCAPQQQAANVAALLDCCSPGSSAISQIPQASIAALLELLDEQASSSKGPTSVGGGGSSGTWTPSAGLDPPISEFGAGIPRMRTRAPIGMGAPAQAGRAVGTSPVDAYGHGDWWTSRSQRAAEVYSTLWGEACSSTGPIGGSGTAPPFGLSPPPGLEGLCADIPGMSLRTAIGMGAPGLGGIGTRIGGIGTTFAGMGGIATSVGAKPMPVGRVVTPGLAHVGTVGTGSATPAVSRMQSGSVASARSAQLSESLEEQQAAGSEEKGEEKDLPVVSKMQSGSAASSITGRAGSDEGGLALGSGVNSALVTPTPQLLELLEEQVEGSEDTEKGENVCLGDIGTPCSSMSGNATSAGGAPMPSGRVLTPVRPSFLRSVWLDGIGTRVGGTATPSGSIAVRIGAAHRWPKGRRKVAAAELVVTEAKMQMESLLNYVAFNRKEPQRVFLVDEENPPPPPPQPFRSAPGEDGGAEVAQRSEPPIAGQPAETANKEAQMVLQGALQLKQPAVAKDLYQHLVSSHFEIAEKTFVLMIESCLLGKDLKNANNFLMKMEASGYSPSSELFDKVIDLHALEKQRKEEEKLQEKQQNEAPDKEPRAPTTALDDSEVEVLTDAEDLPDDGRWGAEAVPEVEAEGDDEDTQDTMMAKLSAILEKLNSLADTVASSTSRTELQGIEQLIQDKTDSLRSDFRSMLEEQHKRTEVLIRSSRTELERTIIAKAVNEARLAAEKEVQKHLQTKALRD